SAGFRVGERELDLPLALRDRLDAHIDRVSEPERSSGAAAGERGGRSIQLEELARQAACGQEALEHLAEAREQARGDPAHDRPLPGLLPAALAEAVLEQPGEADLVREVLELRRLPLALRRVLGELRQPFRYGVVAHGELTEQRAVDDEVRVAPD